MDKYIITYKLDGGSETVVDKSTWNDVESFISSNKSELIEFGVERVGNPTKPTNFGSSASGLFGSAIKLVTVNLTGIDTSSVTSFRYMFRWCYKLETIYMGGLNTSNVEHMGGMFNLCQKLVYVDTGGWDTGKVESMAGMFAGCQLLEEITDTSWNTSNVTDMGEMFSECRVLTQIDTSSWTPTLTRINHMFKNCRAVEVLDLSGFTTSSVLHLGYLFYFCQNLKTIYVSSKWNNSSVTSSESMFAYCSVLEGAVPYDSSKTDATMANYTTGYFTKKPEPLPPYRYWVGGSGNWNDTSHWSASSGGSGGASVPGVNDDVFIDSNSGINGGAIMFDHRGWCKDFICTSGHTYTIKEDDYGGLHISGSLELEPGITWSAGLSLFFDGEGTVKTSGVKLGYVGIGTMLR